MGGVFLVLFVGIGFSFVFTLFELVWEVAVKSIKENVSKNFQRVSRYCLTDQIDLLFFFFSFSF